MTNSVRSRLVVWSLMVWLAGAACRPPPSSSGAARRPSVITNTVRLGRIKELSVAFDWAPNAVGKDTIMRVTRSCGCTVVGVNTGDRIWDGQRVHMSLDLAGKAGGFHRETAFLELASGRSILLAIYFEYVPAPFVTPRQLIFWPGAYARNIEVHAPGVRGVRVSAAFGNMPVHVQKQIRTRDGLRLTVEFDPGARIQVGRGNLRLVVSCGAERSFTIPFTVLSDVP